jgi:type IV pilus assembly protein PilC
MATVTPDDIQQALDAAKQADEDAHKQAEQAAKGAARETAKAVARAEKQRQDAGATWLEKNLPSLFSVKRMELIIFSRQMATFIKAGIPVTDGIATVQEQTPSRYFRRTLGRVALDLQEGEPMSTAMARHPRVFPPLYVDMVRAGEVSGEMDTIMSQVATYLERSDETSKKLRQASLYPGMVLLMAVVVVFIMITFVLPAFKGLFADFNAELPLPTKILLGIGDFGSEYGLITGGIVAMLGVAFYLVRNVGPVQHFRQALSLRLPVVGPMIKAGVSARFARTLGILLHAGVPIGEAFEVAAQGTNNQVFTKRLAPVRERLLAGDGLARPIANAKLFGPLLLQMVKVGEETGTLDTYLEQTSDFLDKDLDYKTKAFVTILEPLLILFVAGLVGFIAISIISPMYSILQYVH